MYNLLSHNNIISTNVEIISHNVNLRLEVILVMNLKL